MDYREPPKSKLHLFSWGTAAENLPLNSKILRVVPNEHSGFLDGQLKSNPQLKTVTGVDSSGAAQQASAYSDAPIPATWYQAGSNRITPPNIRRGERVEIWRFADRPEFLWRAAGLDDNLRRLETVSWAFSGTTDETTTALTPDNAYWMEISAHQKTATFSTSAANGEKVRYYVQFDPGTGKFFIKDDQGQIFYWDSLQHQMVMRNADGSFFLLDKKNVKIAAQNNLNLAATNLIQMDTQTLTINAPTVNGNVNTFSLAGVTIQNGAVKATSYSGDSMTLDSSLQCGPINCESVTAKGTVHGSNI